MMSAKPLTIDEKIELSFQSWVYKKHFSDAERMLEKVGGRYKWQDASEEFELFAEAYKSAMNEVSDELQFYLAQCMAQLSAIGSNPINSNDLRKFAVRPLSEINFDWVDYLASIGIEGDKPDVQH